jgi:hypothetical protein
VENRTGAATRWVLGKNPDVRIILASYGADLATENSRAARDIVDSDKYKALFGNLATVEREVEISTDSRSVQAWDLAGPNRGGVRAVGVGGGITGKGADILIIDDPFKNREEAESEAYRRKVWDWWTSSAYTRLEDHAAVIGMLTRWHGDDWAGRILRLMGGPKAIKMLCVPVRWETTILEEDLHEHKTLLSQGMRYENMYGGKVNIMAGEI